MKRINMEYRKSGNIDIVPGLTEEKKAELKKFLRMFSYEKQPYPTYELSNNGAEIRRVKARMSGLENKQKEIPCPTVQGKGYTIEEKLEDNRIWFIFETKPSHEICQLMRQYGFKWSPTREAWIRMLNSNGRGAAEHLARILNKDS